MTRFPTCLSDNETKVDLLNNQAIAASIVRLLSERPDRPVTIGVHGDWGAGKSSVLEMIEAELEGHESSLCLKFNGWRFQGFEDAKIALIEGIVTGLIEKRPFVSKAGAKVKEVFHRIDWLKVARRAGGLALTVTTGIPDPGLLQGIAATLERVAADPTKLATKENLESVIQGVNSILKPEGESKNVPEEIGAFRKAFDDLLEEAKVDQLVVLIDDLDRCLPRTAIETLEAVRLFVFTARTAFVVAADEAMIEYAVREHFPDLPDTTGPQTYARNYLEKLIQVPFRIPALGEVETRIYVTLLLIGAELGEADPDFEKLIVAARERLRRPWTGGALEAAAVRKALGDKVDRAQDALALSDQIAPILASGTRGNPRQIKRFLNTLVLRQRSADARGFGNDVNVPVLAKLLLAERFLPRLFDQVATAAAAAPDGLCPDLAPLEVDVRDKSGTIRSSRSTARVTGGVKDSPSTQPADTRAGEQLAEWLTSEAIRAWAAVEPPLAGIDLRPYLFMAKERKDYFGAATVLGHLAGIVEQLLGPKMAVQAMSPELKRLKPAEAAQVFELVRGRIMASGSLDTQPPGVDGLIVLVRAHPDLQKDLLGFLESLPPARIGVWVVSGWGGIIKDPEANARLDRLLQNWSADPDNKLLKAAANAVLRTRKGTR